MQIRWKCSVPIKVYSQSSVLMRQFILPSMKSVRIFRHSIQIHRQFTQQSVLSLLCSKNVSSRLDQSRCLFGCRDSLSSKLGGSCILDNLSSSCRDEYQNNLFVLHLVLPRRQVQHPILSSDFPTVDVLFNLPCLEYVFVLTGNLPGKTIDPDVSFLHCKQFEYSDNLPCHLESLSSFLDLLTVSHPVDRQDIKAIDLKNQTAGFQFPYLSRLSLLRFRISVQQSIQLNSLFRPSVLQFKLS